MFVLYIYIYIYAYIYIYKHYFRLSVFADISTKLQKQHSFP